MITSLIAPLILIAVIAFVVAAVMEGKHTMKKGLVIRSLYFYLISLVTLGITVGSLIFLLNLGLKSYVFPEANTTYESFNAPPSLYLNPEAASTKETASGNGALECAEPCTLTDEQQSNISMWQVAYADWKELKENPASGNARDAVNALSFLIIALPFFLFHFRIVQKENRETGDAERSVIRPTYFYFVSLAALLMVVIAGGFLINVGLKTWVFPNVGDDDNQAMRMSMPATVMAADKAAVQSLVTCGDPCQLDEETVTTANQWLADYTDWQSTSGETQVYNNRQRQAASALPFVLIGIPLFWYHWTIVRREAKDKKGQPPASPEQSAT